MSTKPGDITPKPVKVFTRDDPCTKVHLSNCFTQGGRYVARAVIEARGEIGVNAIKYLLREGYATAYESVGIDWWRLTPDGEAWLAKGLARHLELHPEDARELSITRTLPATTPRIIRRPRKGQ